MSELSKISRVLQLIAQLRSPLGVDKDEFARRHQISVRSVERYINLLKNDLSFNISKDNKRFRIDETKKTFHHEDFTVFTLEEAALIKNAILNFQTSNDLLSKNILTKLYSLSDLEEISKAFASLHISQNISILRRAISDKKQAHLVQYASANSNNIRDRTVEPIRFEHYFEYLTALDLEDMKVKQFKIERINEVNLSKSSQKFEHLHQSLFMDDFYMSGTKMGHVELQLTLRAKQLLTEDFPNAQKHLTAKNGTCFYAADVADFEGIGRFVLGLPAEVEVIGNEAFKEFLKKKGKFN
jgi:proteasome accessory factor C